jgi:hypothetical protein
VNRFSTSTLISLENIPQQMLELDIIIPENYILPLQNYFMYIPESARANIFISGISMKMYFLADDKMICPIGDVAGPYFWLGQEQALTADNLIYKTVSSAEGALLGFGTMVYNIIYLRQGHGGRGFDQTKLLRLLDLVNIGKFQ